MHSSVIKKLINELNDSYVYVEKAHLMQKDICKRLKNKEYDGFTNGNKFAEKLTKDLQRISKDKHLRVRYSLRLNSKKKSEVSDDKADDIRLMEKINYGFEKIECLTGNIGYINLRGFYDPEAGAKIVGAAMTFIMNTEALIFDLRQNGGGNPGMVALISSYLFGNKPIHLNSLYFRKEDKTDEFWTKPAVARKKYKKDVYVLTSSYTFSAAEEFCYNLKNLKRAKIIGEVTHGGANPGQVINLGNHFTAFLPTGRAINPITQTNWDGLGIEPDVSVAKEKALQIAYEMALKKAIKTIENH
jgi:C-terminal processing protease CtpA/Prc